MLGSSALLDSPCVVAPSGFHNILSDSLPSDLADHSASDGVISDLPSEEALISPSDDEERSSRTLL